MSSDRINFERSELRYIFYSHDKNLLIEDFAKLGFQILQYSDTPITRTLYFGSKAGIKPGLSIKARLYTNERLQNHAIINGDTKFNLLEIKSTINPQEVMYNGITTQEIDTPALLKEDIYDSLGKDVVFRIQRASENGLFKVSTYKSKSRVDQSMIGDNTTTPLTLKQIINIMTSGGDVEHKFSPEVRTLFSERIRPLYYDNLVPALITQYERIHLVTDKKEWKDAIRITIDPGVEYYSIDSKIDFNRNPHAELKFINREEFYRIEFKVDPNLLKSDLSLGIAISNILRKYGCIAYLSKKWTGITHVSEHYINSRGFWREPIGKQISCFFPVHDSWYEYGRVSSDVYSALRKSESFRPYRDPPKLLIKNENFVTGYLGLPVPSLVISVEGPEILYNLPSKSYPVRLTRGQPELYILEEPEIPVRKISISSKEELDKILHPSIKIEGDTFFRSFGFLVMSYHSQRVYKLTIERMIKMKGTKPESEIYCKLRYIGTENWLLKTNEQDIYNELVQFYDEFSGLMTKSLESSSGTNEGEINDE